MDTNIPYIQLDTIQLYPHLGYTTLLLITHDVKLAGRCARVVTMRDGLLSEAPRAEAGQRQAVSAE